MLVVAIFESHDSDPSPSVVVFFFQAEDGIRDLVRSRGLGDVYKRQGSHPAIGWAWVRRDRSQTPAQHLASPLRTTRSQPCLLYTSDAADERSSVDLGGRRIINKKKIEQDHPVSLRYTTRNQEQSKRTQQYA